MLTDTWLQDAGGDFADGWSDVATFVHQTAMEKGWWDEDRSDGEIIALIHSELSEALEGLRHGDAYDKHLPEFRSVEVELADAVIRIMDYGEARGLRIAQALMAKATYNLDRPRMHGGKAF